MSFGGQTVTFVTVTEDTNNRDRYGNPALVRAEVDVAGCHFRPLSAKETLGLGDIATDPWKCTAPPVAAALGATVNSEVKHNGITYQVIAGARPYSDFSDSVFKVTIICQRQVG